MQKKDTQWKPVTYASCSMSEADEQSYAQIEKEGLAVKWAVRNLLK